MRPDPGSPQLTRRLALQIRRHALRMVTQARASHIGSALSIADIVAVLYGAVLKLDPANPRAARRDRFILSKGHACVAVYAALAETGFFPRAWLDSYGAPDSPLLNHISHSVPGAEFSTGSLGHGLPFGAGKALALRRARALSRVFVLMSDGELDEGSNWEAFMFAAHHKLDRLHAIIDYNKLQSLTSITRTLGLEPLADKLRAFGWAVREVDGHNHEALQAALGEAQPGQPSALIAHTTKGKGVSFMEDQVAWHYRSPDAAQLTQALAELEAHHA